MLCINSSVSQIKLIPTAPNFTPNFTITELNEQSNITNVTISWTAANAIDVDGYVVYSYTLPQTHGYTANSTDVQNNTQYTVEVQLAQHGYIFQVRAYQDLLGPGSTKALNGKLKTIMMISVAHVSLLMVILVVVRLLNWTLLSKRTSLEVKYRVSWVTQYLDPPQQVQWMKNGEIIMNSTSHQISFKNMSFQTEHILMVSSTVYESQTVRYVAVYDNVVWKLKSREVLLEGKCIGSKCT